MAGLDGMEIYNRHADAKKDAAGVLAIMLKLTEPRVAPRARGEPDELYPDELFAAQVEYPARSISPNGTPRQKRGGSPASPPMTAITTGLARQDGGRRNGQGGNERRSPMTRCASLRSAASGRSAIDERATAG